MARIAINALSARAGGGVVYLGSWGVVGMYIG